MMVRPLFQSQRNPRLHYQRAKAEASKTRPCLRCRQAFKSQGSHNRLCPACKDAVAQDSAVAEYPVGRR